MPDTSLPELGFYALPGHTDTPRDAITEARDGEALGLGSAFVSERFNVKDAGVLSGAIGAVTDRLGIATAATNHNTRHLLATATMATTMHRLTGGRFALGLGRGFDFLFDVINLPRITNAQIEDAVGIYRRLWHGEVVMGHDGPAGTYSVLHQDARFAEDIPVILCALAEQTLERAGRLRRRRGAAHLLHRRHARPVGRGGAQGRRARRTGSGERAGVERARDRGRPPPRTRRSCARPSAASPPTCRATATCSCA